MRISPAVHPKNARRYAHKYYEIEDDVIPIFEQLDTPFLDAILKPGMRVLDAMMGRGRHTIRYANRGCIVTGNDLNPHMVRLARAAAKKAGLPPRRCRLMVGDVTRLPLPDDTFDVTFAMFSAVGTIPGSAKRQAAIDEMARVTKPGGLVIVHAHNRLDGLLEKDYLPWLIQTTFAPAEGLETGDMVTDYNGLQDMFNHFYTPGELRRSMRQGGLKVTRFAYMRYHPPRFIRGIGKRVRADGFIAVGEKHR